MTEPTSRGALDDVHAVLGELTGVVEHARAMPMSASCVVNRGEVLDLLHRLRAALPTAMDQARSVLDEREAVLDEGRRDAERLRVEAEAERERLMAGTAVHEEAETEAMRILDEAVDRAKRLQAEADDYVDAKLANFEIVLGRTLEAVERGRKKLAGHSDLDDLRDGVPDDRPLPG